MGKLKTNKLMTNECWGCACLYCSFKGDCHCPHKKGQFPGPSLCHNYTMQVDDPKEQTV